jgi:uncharacterized cysteine cluster protein YcgN (CxxCxxCC family)
MNINDFYPKKPLNFSCEKCDFNTSNKKDYNRHLQTKKHNLGQNQLISMDFTPNNPYLCECGKKYKDYSGLWRHKKVCNESTHLEEENVVIKEEKIVIQEKNELIQYLINENKEFKNLILELAKKDSVSNSHNINTIHTNSHNKTFNLQFFLNETCKDAMNMSDFINSLTLQLSDLENVGKLGFVDGISNIIIKNLEALDVEKRPVHCSDSKRETMYIKDHDKWEKDDSELKQMRELVRYVRDKNISMVNTWRDLYPECVKSDSKKTTQFNQIYMEAFGGEKGTKDEKECKIISKIAKSVVIDKSTLLEKV